MRLVVCGGRDFGRQRFDHIDEAPSPQMYRDDQRRTVREVGELFDALDVIHLETPVTELAHGGASGADTHAGHWCVFRAIPCRVFEARWEEHGKAAGPIRNELMLADFRPDLVVAFRGGRGTADCIRRARRLGIPVKEIP